VFVLACAFKLLAGFCEPSENSKRYAEALKRTNSKSGKYVSPTTAEYFSGGVAG